MDERRVVRLIGCVIVASVLFSIASAAAQEATPEPDALAELAFELLNATRVEHGLTPLTLDPNLSRIAQRHSRELAASGKVSHHSSLYQLSTERRVRISYPRVPRFAENVSRGRNVEALHADLLNSEGHRRNRLDAEFTHVGVGIASDGGYALYYTEVFVTAADGGELETPRAFYFDASPGSYEARDNPRVEQGAQTFIVGAPDGDDPEHWTNVGIDAYLAGRLQAAEDAFRQALTLKPDYHYAQYNLARVLISQGSPEEASGLLDALIAADPGDIDAIATRGTAALFLEQHEEAAEFFRRVLRSRPSDASSWYNLGLSLELLDRFADAETAYRQALKFDPGLTAAHVGLARVTRR